MIWDCERFYSLMFEHVDGLCGVIAVGNGMSLEWAWAR